ncbi:hypothetical protein GJ629_13455 [Halapricum sp. CBA1109]|uniref:hypothetical protein n=1 Tax=Halapricum sp. CBA1109 TaxID=2668068 RepID=UPI0012FAC750|nr:hypothetical protein [Halapricum sp. CBA1109]MUV90780.1 hypothetical protein [Halapricum sp. CBA1109]
MSEMRTRDDTADEEDPDADTPSVTAHECSGDRTVFTERGNNDGWIATDLTISANR